MHEENVEQVKPRYRLLWVSPGWERYGVASLILSLSKAMADAGHDVRVVSLGPGFLVDECQRLGIRCLEIDCPVPGQFYGGPLQKLWHLLKVLYDSRQATRRTLTALGGWSPQVVHVARPNLLEYATSLAQHYQARTVWEMPSVINRKLPFDLAWRYYSMMCRKHRVVVLADSNFTGQTIASENVQPITFYHALDDSRFDPARVTPVRRNELGYAEDDIVMGIVSRICRPKGQHLVAEAVIELTAEVPNLKLMLIGAGKVDDALDRIEERIAQSGTESRVQIIGERCDVERYYPMMDFSINSRVDPEPFGISVIESMLMGTPVLVHALGGPAETVIDGETGWHVHEPSVEAFKAGILRAVADRDRWPAMRKMARVHALQTFGTSASVQRYSRILDDMQL